MLDHKKTNCVPWPSLDSKNVVKTISNHYELYPRINPEQERNPALIQTTRYETAKPGHRSTIGFWAVFEEVYPKTQSILLGTYLGQYTQLFAEIRKIECQIQAQLENRNTETKDDAEK